MIRPIVRTVGELMITAGLVALLYVVYAVWWTGAVTETGQQKLIAGLTESVPASPAGGKPSPSKPAAEPTPPVPGHGLAVMRIPRLGADWEWAIVEGVERVYLADGPGHYPDTALPGQVGNFAVAGHQVTHGSPFAELSHMRPGDTILVDYQGSRYTYVVDSTRVVLPGAVGVVLPVPDQPGAKPTRKLITLTTCHPPLRSTERFIVFGHQIDAAPIG